MGLFYSYSKSFFKTFEKIALLSASPQRCLQGRERSKKKVKEEKKKSYRVHRLTDGLEAAEGEGQVGETYRYRFRLAYAGLYRFILACIGLGRTRTRTGWRDRQRSWPQDTAS